jgi:hypothetical protein
MTRSALLVIASELIVWRAPQFAARNGLFGRGNFRPFTLLIINAADRAP